MSWKEEFRQTFSQQFGELTLLSYRDKLEQFISDIRKRDEEELINRMPYYSSDGNNDTENGYNKYRDECLKIISDYYKD